MNINNITPPANKDIKYANSDDRLDVELKREINMEYLQEENMDQYNADVLL